MYTRDGEMMRRNRHDIMGFWKKRRGKGGQEEAKKEKEDEVVVEESGVRNRNVAPQVK